MRQQPQRSCIGCRTVRDKRDLVRVVHTPEDRYLLDPRGKLPGRGAYVCLAPACLALAVKRKAFDRAFRQSVPRDAVTELERQVEEHLRGRNAGQASAAAGREGTETKP